MDPSGQKERSLDATSTWAVAVVCLVLVGISLFIEHLFHNVEKMFKKAKKPALVVALEKVKTELMLMGFISLLLTVGQGPISEICVSPKIATSWLPCSRTAKETTKIFGQKDVIRRSLAVAPIDKCSTKGKVAFVSAYGIHQLHYFIFVLAVLHIFYCIVTYILGRSKMRQWKKWEEEAQMMDLTDYNDPERYRVAKDTSFGRRHIRTWSHSSISLWIVSFFRQFFGSVTKVDYRTLRYGFISAHFHPGSETSFDFHSYINGSLEEDFTGVVEINRTMWGLLLFFFLSKTYGWHAYLWLPFIPLIMALVIGTKLQVVMSQLGLRIEERGDMVQGALVVQPGDDLFWFGKPKFLLFLIHIILFQNAFQLAYFIWVWWKIGISSCMHSGVASIVIKILMGILIQILCSYVTLPLYSLVHQMGSSVRETMFNSKNAEALKNWPRDSRKPRKESKHPDSIHMSSAPGTAGERSPNHSTRLSNPNSDSAPQSPRPSDYETEPTVAPPTPSTTEHLLLNQGHGPSHLPYHVPSEGSKRMLDPRSKRMFPPVSSQRMSSRHEEIHIELGDLSTKN